MRMCVGRLLRNTNYSFLFLLCKGLQQNKSPVNSDEWLFLLTGGAALESPHANPALTWLKDKLWGEIL